MDRVGERGASKMEFEEEMLELFHQLTIEEKLSYLSSLRCLVASQSDGASAQE